MMQMSKEYAEALFTLATEENCRQEIADALAVISAAFEENEGYLEVLSSPAIPASERLAAIDAAFSSLYEYAVSFLKLLCERSVIRAYPAVAAEYDRLLKEANKLRVVKVTSAVALTDDEVAALRDKLGAMCKHPVSFEFSLDESLLGGMVVETDGKVYDASLARKLRDLKDVISR